MKKILIIGLGSQNPKNKYIFNTIKKLKYDFYILKSYNDNIWFADYIKADHILSGDVYNSSKTIADLSVFVKLHNIKFSAILTFDEHLVMQTSIIAQSFDCIATPLFAVMHSYSNKLLFRETYNRINDKNLIKTSLSVVEQLSEKILKNIKQDKVIKPLFGNNSYGVMKISQFDNIKYIQNYIKSSWSCKQEENYKNFNNVFLLEDYIDGDTFSIDGIVQNGKIHFAGINQFGYSPEPFFIQISNTIPSKLSIRDQNLCYTTIKRLIKQLRFNNTAFHAEVKYNNNHIYVIEIAVRAPGGQIMKAYESAYGFNFVKQVINLYLGKKVCFKHSKDKFIFQKGFYIYKNCILKNFVLKNKLPKNKEYIKIANNNQSITYPIDAIPLYYYALEENDRDTIIEKSCKIEQSHQIDIE